MPIIGAVLGAFIYEIVVGVHLPGAGGREVEVDEDYNENESYLHKKEMEA